MFKGNELCSLSLASCHTWLGVFNKQAGQLMRGWRLVSPCQVRWGHGTASPPAPPQKRQIKNTQTSFMPEYLLRGISFPGKLLSSSVSVCRFPPPSRQSFLIVCCQNCWATKVTRSQKQSRACPDRTESQADKFGTWPGCAGRDENSSNSSSGTLSWPQLWPVRDAPGVSEGRWTELPISYPDSLKKCRDRNQKVTPFPSRQMQGLSDWVCSAIFPPSLICLFLQASVDYIKEFHAIGPAVAYRGRLRSSRNIPPVVY